MAAKDEFMQATGSCGGKGTVRSLPQEESTRNIVLTGFYCFSEYITLRMILIYYARAQFRRLQKTKERAFLITSKKQDICKCKGKSG